MPHNSLVYQQIIGDYHLGFMEILMLLIILILGGYINHLTT